MSGAGDVNHIEIVLLDDSIQVHVNEILPRRRTPMSQQHALHVLKPQRLPQEWVVTKIHLPDGQIIGRPPVRVHFLQECRRKRVRCHDLTSCQLSIGRG